MPKDVSEDLSNSDTRLSVQLNGFELHTYNRSHVYRDLEKKFGLEPGLLPGKDDEEEVGEKEDEGGGASLSTDWRDLIPVIKVDISTCKFVFGNRLLPTTLLVTVEEAHFTYSTKPASTSLDHFMHFVKTKAENLKVVLAESPKYTGLRAHDEAPRYMGEGFVVLASNQVRLFYHKDVFTNCTTYITSTATCNICTTYAICTTCTSRCGCTTTKTRPAWFQSTHSCSLLPAGTLSSLPPPAGAWTSPARRRPTSVTARGRTGRERCSTSSSSLQITRLVH